MDSLIFLQHSFLAFIKLALDILQLGEQPRVVVGHLITFFFFDFDVILKIFDVCVSLFNHVLGQLLLELYQIS